MEGSDDGNALPREHEELKTRKDKYRVLELVGRGGFGAVYSVLRVSDSEKFAIKCESANVARKALYMDCNVLRGAAHIKSRHFCTVVDRAAVKGRFNFIVMKLIGRNMWDLRMDTEDLRFSLGTALKAAAQCLVCIEQIHRFGYLHRDVKPGNFAAGRRETNEHHVIFLLDFGLCREYVNRSGGKLRTQRTAAPFRGTTRYAPLATMLELDTGRKDDIESWLYMVVEWTSGQLPWHKWKSIDRDQVRQEKQDLRTKPEVLEDFLYDCPKKEFTRILKDPVCQKLQYIETLDFYAAPDYQFIYCCIQHAAATNNIKDTDPLDWDPNNAYAGPIETPGDGKVIEFELEHSSGPMSSVNAADASRRARREREKEKEREKERETEKTRQAQIKRSMERKKKN